jgi:hypothetical protein
VFENRVLRRIFGTKGEEVEGDWRRLHNEELRYSYASPNIIKGIKSRRMRWTGHVAHMGEMRNASKIWSTNLTGRDHSEDLGIDGKKILEWILGKYGGKVWTGCTWLRIGTRGGLL